MKKGLFLLFSCLLLVSMVLPACKGPVEKANTLKIGVIGPMQYIQGKHNWIGAEMARDEINAAGGIKVGDETYMIELIQSDSNEINSITDAATAMEKLILVDKADFIMGGFRTEAITPMIEVAMDNKKVFLVCGCSALQIMTPVSVNYDRYKYLFRVTPFANTYLIDNMVMELAMAGAIIKADTGVTRPLRVAICSEGAQWADTMTQIMKSFVPSKLKMEVSGVWRPSPTATELNAEMSAIEAANTDIIATIISGPLGIPYGRSLGELKVPAASLGINVESQAVPGYMQNTNKLGMYDTSLSSYAEGVAITPLTLPFFTAFEEKTGEAPAYNAGTYDAIYTLKSALEKAGTLDSDAMVGALEKVDQPSTSAVKFVFTGAGAKLNNPHDVTYGPGFSTGIATQWQPDANGEGQCVAVWPNPAYASEYTAAGYSADWGTVNYPGIAKWQIAPPLLDKLNAEVGAAPAAPATPTAPSTPTEEPAASPAGGEELPFEAKTYTNTQYGFSIQYPKEWVPNPSIITVPTIHMAAFSVESFVPGVVCMVYDKPEAITKDWVVSAFKSTGNVNPKVTSDISEITLSDGTKAYQYTAGYISATGYEVKSYVVDAIKGDKVIRVNCYTVDTFAPYDEVLQGAVARSLTLQ